MKTGPQSWIRGMVHDLMLPEGLLTPSSRRCSPQHGSSRFLLHVGPVVAMKMEMKTVLMPCLVPHQGLYQEFFMNPASSPMRYSYFRYEFTKVLRGYAAPKVPELTRTIRKHTLLRSYPLRLLPPSGKSPCETL